jgi:PPOX class probable F420-dependent enzyme
VKLPAQEIERLLETWPVARLATLAADGRLHQVPIVFARVDGALWSPIDAKPKADRELARIAHLRQRPRASLLLDHYEPDWSRLWWLRVDVEAEIVEPADAGADRRAAAAVAALRRKYPQYAALPVLRDPPTLVSFEPDAVSSWCAGPQALR